jgi:uncharacterized membrane-anchored protein YhcB (DUF1043 family)
MSDWPLSGAWIFWGLVGLGIAFGIARGLIVRLRENAYNAKLRAYLDGRDASFKAGFLTGRRWLAVFIAEAEQARDLRDDYLRSKSHPARKSADIVREVKAGEASTCRAGQVPRVPAESIRRVLPPAGRVPGPYP